MPFYKPTLDRLLMMKGEAAHRRACQRLLDLRRAFRGELEADGVDPAALAIPSRVDGHLLLATWNIREFDSDTYGWRDDEALIYLAEIISRFDLVAIQEVRRSVNALERLVRILGDGWEYVVTDLVAYRTGGNHERLAYVYDTRRVKFRGLAGELSLEPEKEPDGSYRRFAFARDPYVVGFRSEWFKFCLVTVHILWGDSAGEYPPRVREIEAVADAVRDRARSDYAWSNHHILLGDFNIFQTDHATYEALANRGFRIPVGLQRLPSNIPQTRHYDQIAFMSESIDLLIDVQDVKCGVFNAFKVVYRDDEVDAYRSELETHVGADDDPADVYAMWRTHQLSDHLPMWVQLRTDHAEDYLSNYRSAMVRGDVDNEEPGATDPE
ncbi:MAG: endonuclease/exonuclease/phosphatase family protein [Thermoanaerobaculales bacterium]|jgi:endonuclease/exonuclease/phosphatase family metal-dependent hydrolase|nr:endonuclease/exonuclease/phosphatase family protein [Thermoanaerobaculales bacterium]